MESEGDLSVGEGRRGLGGERLLFVRLGCRGLVLARDEDLRRLDFGAWTRDCMEARRINLTLLFLNEGGERVSVVSSVMMLPLAPTWL